MEAIITIVGFLGAGKTTLLKQLSNQYLKKGWQPFIILNDYENADFDKEQLAHQVKQLQHQLKWLQRQMFGQKSERRLLDMAEAGVEQYELDLGHEFGMAPATLSFLRREK